MLSLMGLKCGNIALKDITFLDDFRFLQTRVLRNGVFVSL